MSRESSVGILLAMLRSGPRSFADLAEAGFTPQLLRLAAEDLADRGEIVAVTDCGIELSERRKVA